MADTVRSLHPGCCDDRLRPPSLGKLELPGAIERFIPEQLAANRFRQLDIELRHVARVAELAFHHRDPFGRLLAAQALEEGLAIVSADPVFRRYRIRRIW